MFQIKAKLIKNIAVTPKYYKILLYCPQIAEEAIPGQFLNIRVSKGLEPLLRRPFSIHRLNGAHIEIFFEVIGEGSRILSKKKPGEYLDIIGPLGNGFDYTVRNTQYARQILIAGGMGIAPLFFLAEEIKRNTPYAHRNTTILIGAKTKTQILCEKEFKKLGCEVKVATDNGSKGYRGKVTDLLKVFLRNTPSARRMTIYACGPRPMLKAVSAISQRYNVPAQISLEEHMACGIGACLGCVVKTHDALGATQYEYKRVCKDGPVFKAEKIVWD